MLVETRGELGFLPFDDFHVLPSCCPKKRILIPINVLNDRSVFIVLADGWELITFSLNPSDLEELLQIEVKSGFPS